MGPRAFMAPELEQGGQLDVTPSVDLYSLGKVIYFMLSGGIIIPRERIHEPAYRAIFNKSERYRLLEILLRQLICQNDARIRTADEVIVRLDKIEQWEQNARAIPVSESALSAIAELQRRSLESARIVAENQNAREHELQTLGAVQTSLTAWLKAELEKTAAMIATDTIRVSVKDASLPSNGFLVETGHRSRYVAINGVEVVLEDVHDPRGRRHALQLFVCKHQHFTVIVTSGPQKNPLPQEEPVRDIELAVLPFYKQTLYHGPPRGASAAGYISRRARMGTNLGHLALPQRQTRGQRRRVTHSRVEPVTLQFEPDISLHTPFRASEWPGNEDVIRAMLREAIDEWVRQASA